MLYDISEITIGTRKRTADASKVAELANSIAEIGLINPITISPAGDLIAGLHRLEACKSLGFRRIEVNTLDIDPLMAELAEIDENLIRNNLNALQEGLQLARRKAIYEQLHPETRHGGDRKSEEAKSSGNNFHLIPSFAEDTAAKTGKTDRTIRNKTRIGEALADVAMDLIGTPIEDSQKDLLSLASMTPDVRDQVVDKIVSGAAVDVASAAKQVRADTRAANPPQQLPDACIVEHGNSTAHIRSNSIDAIVTDPPYGISHYGGVTKVGDQIVTADFDGDDAWDSIDPAAFLDTLYGWIEEWERLLKPGGSVIAFCDRALVSHMWDAMKRVGLKPKQIIIWRKTNPSPAGLARKNLISATEFMVWAVAPGAPYVFNEVDDWDRHNVITTPIIGGHEKVDHPTQKPIAVLSKLIQLTSNPGDLILDPFAGSGSTGVTALGLGRCAHLIDQDKNYVRLAQERLAALSAQEAAA